MYQQSLIVFKEIRSLVLCYVQTDGQKYMAKLIHAFLQFFVEGGEALKESLVFPGTSL
jgi:hypothetical protein